MKDYFFKKKTFVIIGIALFFVVLGIVLCVSIYSQKQLHTVKNVQTFTLREEGEIDLNLNSETKLVENTNESVASFQDGKIVAHSVGETTLTYNDADGNVIQYHIIVEKNDTIETINLQDNYSCKSGESFEIDIEISGGNIPVYAGATISDSSIATLKEDPNNQPKCINCRKLKVECQKGGTTTLTVKSQKGTSKTA
ncbi:MAG: hypothetical protein IKN63_02635, partial [Bacilli bacterium]|nr:hypothetical protein [Bacilli bacterium]